MATLTLGEIKANRFAVLAQLPPDTLEKQKKALSYIELVASQIGTDISQWPLSEIFKTTAPEGLVIVDKRTINQRFFTHLAQITTREIPNEYAAADTRIQAFLTTNANRIRRDQEGRLERTIESTMASITTNDHANQRHWTTVAACRRQLEAMRGGEDYLLLELRKIAKSSFWMFKTNTEERIDFVTRGDVVMAYKNEAQGVDMSVNFGILKASLNLVHGLAYIHPNECNFKYNGYFHTYVSQEGVICFGNQAENARNLLKNSQYSTLMELIAGLLTTYDPSSTPHMALERFHHYQKHYPNGCPECGGSWSQHNSECRLGIRTNCDYCSEGYWSHHSSNCRYFSRPLVRGVGAVMTMDQMNAALARNPEETGIIRSRYEEPEEEILESEEEVDF